MYFKYRRPKIEKKKKNFGVTQVYLRIFIIVNSYVCTNTIHVVRFWGGGGGGMVEL